MCGTCPSYTCDVDGDVDEDLGNSDEDDEADCGANEESHFPNLGRIGGFGLLSFLNGEVCSEGDERSGGDGDGIGDGGTWI